MSNVLTMLCISFLYKYYTNIGMKLVKSFLSFQLKIDQFLIFMTKLFILQQSFQELCFMEKLLMLKILILISKKLFPIVFFFFFQPLSL